VSVADLNRSSLATFRLAPLRSLPILYAMAEQKISEVLAKPDVALEMTLRPSLFSEFTGQLKVKERLEITVAAAKQRQEAIDHLLFSGPPGLGKTTLAHILAKAMGTNLKITSGLTIDKTVDLIGLLTNLEEGDFLLIEEVHLLPKTLVQCLCQAMTDFKLDVVIDQGPNARSVRLNLPRFTVIGTTTRKKRLVHSFLSCFPIDEQLGNYAPEELAIIAVRFAKVLNIGIDHEAANRIAHSASGTPLGVLNRLRRVRDYAQIKHDGQITVAALDEALQMLTSADEPNESLPGRENIASEVRREVWRRDGGKCVRCGSRENLEYDHIIPVSMGGSNTARNVELLCERCNRSKGATID
jgi:Holliday junction DNA helicase RuvB